MAKASMTSETWRCQPCQERVSLWSSPFWFWLGLGFGAWVLLPLLTLPWAVTVARVVATHDRREQLFPMTPKASALALAYAVLLAIGVAVSAS